MKTVVFALLALISLSFCADPSVNDSKCTAIGGQCRPNAQNVCRDRLVRAGMCGGTKDRMCCLPDVLVTNKAEAPKVPKAAGDDKDLKSTSKKAAANTETKGDFKGTAQNDKPPSAPNKPQATVIPDNDDAPNNNNNNNNNNNGNKSNNGKYKHTAGLPTFSKVLEAYKAMTYLDSSNERLVMNSTQIKTLIGGAADAAWVTNTCAIRMSRVFNYAGLPIPNGVSGLLTVKGKDGKRYAFRVKEFLSWAIKKFGKPALVIKSSEKAKIEGMRGLIVFTNCDFDDATGHLDWWNKDHSMQHSYFDRCSTVSLFPVDN